MKFYTALVINVLCLLLTCPGSATTIIPFLNTGEMALASDAVVVARATRNFETVQGISIRFRTSFEVLEAVKGTLRPNDYFELQAWKQRVGTAETVVWGDPDFQEGKTYLLFLSNRQIEPYWQPITLAYGIFELEVIGNDAIFLPSRESMEIEMLPRPDGLVPEPVTAYLAAPLLEQLLNITSGNGRWNANAIEAEEVYHLLEDRSAPSHCTFLNSGGINFRYTDFPADDLVIFSEDDGDASIGVPGTPADAHSYLSSAVSVMAANYSGINLSYGGTKNFSPDCTGGVAQNGNFLSEIGMREGLVIYNDPCNQITNLAGCSGTLAISGMWVTGQHTYDGATWYSGWNSYLVINNGVGACLSVDDYGKLLTHELSHGLGLGHIAGNGTANMNPSCCTSIQSLDTECMNYAYEAASLPVEWLEFRAENRQNTAELSWSTASEKNSDHFLVEHSERNAGFGVVGRVEAAGNSMEKRTYRFVHSRPSEGTNYYRIRQVELDGKFEFSKIIAVEFTELEDQLTVFPNPSEGSGLSIRFISKEQRQIRLAVFDLTGRQILTGFKEVEKGVNVLDLDVAAFFPGIYLLQTLFDGKVLTERIVRM